MPLIENSQSVEGEAISIGPGEEYSQPFYAYTSFDKLELVLNSERVPKNISLILQTDQGEEVATTVIGNENLALDQKYGGTLLCTFPVSRDGQPAEEGSYTLVIRNESEREFSVCMKQQKRTEALPSDENGYSLNLGVYTDSRLAGKKNVLFLNLSAFLVIFLTPVMLLKDTPLVWEEIAGVQGRYFTPALPLILLTLPPVWNHLFHSRQQGSSLRLLKKDHGILLEAFAVVSCLIIYYMLRTYLTR